ncbi:unnamed protein product [Angiostrongylus costaricensis]|uniref:Uncharacterized protein n=1 Tax=Angiostrongylus costaricensis TaxID=334426 RepID=A0A0R3PC05_ANGCS|nr:unnamed protein product [Angiostrongylus costaricensis]
MSWTTSFLQKNSMYQIYGPSLSLHPFVLYISWACSGRQILSRLFGDRGW